jgi:hypothetical protein
MNKQPEITASLDAASGAATISIQLAPNVKIVLEVANRGYVVGKIISDVPKAAVLDEAKFSKMIADEQDELQAEINASRERQQRRLLGLG